MQSVGAAQRLSQPERKREAAPKARPPCNQIASRKLLGGEFEELVLVGACNRKSVGSAAERPCAYCRPIVREGQGRQEQVGAAPDSVIMARRTAKVQHGRTAQPGDGP